MRSRLIVILLLVAPHGFAATLALRGTVITPAAVLNDAYVVIDNEKIVSVETTAPRDIAVINTDGVIVPGLIDLHNHVTWNAQPRWSPKTRPLDRYEWITDPDYLVHVSGPQYAVRAGAACEENEYGEMRALIGGTTSIAGSLGPAKPGDPSPACIAGLVRNLDEAAGAGPGLKNTVAYVVFPFELPPDKSLDLLNNVKAKNVRAVFHVAEGVDAPARREFRWLQQQGYLLDGVSFIHGVALTATEFAAMKANGVGLIWSPRTNMELYGRTADIAAARAAGVRIAIAPDWAISGSENLLAELRYASRLSAAIGSKLSSKELLAMATSVPAQLAGIDAQLGTIEPNKLADLLVVKRSGGDPYDAVIATTPRDVLLVVVGGAIVLRDDTVTPPAASPNQEAIDVCGRRKWATISSSMQSFASVVSRLSTAFSQAGTSLAPLSDCRD